MTASPFSHDEARLLEKDAEFQRRVSTDAELNRLFNPPPDDEDEREQTARALGSGLVIAGVPLPPPTVGTFRLLSLVNSEFLAAERKFEDLAREVTLALYVMSRGHRAVMPYCEQFRARRVIERYAKHAAESPAHLDRLIAEERRLAKELAGWDAALARFSSTVIKPAGMSLTEIAAEIDAYLSAALAGFDLLPQVVRAGETGADRPKARRGTTTTRPRSSPWYLRLARLFRCGKSAGGSRL